MAGEADDVLGRQMEGRSVTVGWAWLLAWAALDLGFLCGCAWVASRRPEVREHTIYVPLPVEGERPHLRVLP